MGLRLYFLRHGQTAYSQTGGYCGKIETYPGLTPGGYQMAQSFADVYAHIPWEAIYVSPLYRTRETIRPLCEKIGVSMQLREGLQEFGYGQWVGMLPYDIDRDYHVL